MCRDALPMVIMRQRLMASTLSENGWDFNFSCVEDLKTDLKTNETLTTMPYGTDASGQSFQ